ncbi:hypothetical protein [Streptomyces sp. NBC_00096]|uniref:hypothetical protein n=1 Tax=Streptomyces sp. NBC_00096 TaxID=2975650 RepID=UPI00324ACB0E
MTSRGMYFATAALSTLALGVVMASGWGAGRPDGGSAGTGADSPPAARSSDRPAASTRVEANVQHVDATPTTDGTDRVDGADGTEGTDGGIVWN